MGDMAEIFNAMKEADKAARNERLDAFKAQIAGDDTWRALSDNHFRKVVDKANSFDYWPSTMLVRWRGKSFRGIEGKSIEGFIANRRDR